MKPKDIKKLLFSEINSVSKKSDDYCISSGKDFTRKRKLPFETVIKTIIGMESKSMTNELINIFDANPNMPSASAFVQQRCKIKPEAFKDIFNNFSSNLVNESDENLRILAVDGTDVQIATNPNDLSSFHQGINGRKGYNLIHLNALYDIKNHIYTDAVIQGKINYNEHRALQKMIDESNIKNALVIADRGYESYNNMAHIQEKGWYFLIRIKDGKNGIKAGLNLPKTNEFDEKINLKLSRRQTKQTKELFKAKNQYKFLPANSEFDYLKTKQRKHDPL